MLESIVHLLISLLLELTTNLCFYTVIPIGYFGWMEVNIYVHPEILISCLVLNHTENESLKPSASVQCCHIQDNISFQNTSSLTQ